jgi:hypothetical protein
LFLELEAGHPAKGRASSSPLSPYKTLMEVK